MTWLTLVSVEKDPESVSEGIPFVFLAKNNEAYQVKANVGETLLQVAHRSSVPLEGACGGSLSCSTCHVVLEEDFYHSVTDNNPISDDENDMLDYAYGVTQCSRLGCQVKVDESFKGASIQLPPQRWDFLSLGDEP